MKTKFFWMGPFYRGHFCYCTTANGLSIGQKLNPLEYRHITQQSAAILRRLRKIEEPYVQN